VPANPADVRRRWFGVFFLLIAAGMLIWGQTILKPYLVGIGFVLYWLACMAFTGLALVTALLDIWAVRRRTREQQRDLLQRIFDEAEANEENKTKEPDGN
jgi:membrane protein implicated in regulation of membrane protease activity